MQDSLSAGKESLTSLLSDKGQDGKSVKNVYHNKQSGSYLFRIHNKNHVVTVTMTGCNFAEHAALRECLLSALGEFGESLTNTSPEVLNQIRSDIRVVESHANEGKDGTGDKQLNFPASVGIYIIYLSKRASWLNKLVEKGVISPEDPAVKGTEAAGKAMVGPHSMRMSSTTADAPPDTASPSQRDTADAGGAFSARRPEADVVLQGFPAGTELVEEFQAMLSRNQGFPGVTTALELQDGSSQYALDLSLDSAQQNLVTHELLCHGVVHAACVRALLFHCCNVFVTDLLVRVVAELEQYYQMQMPAAAQPSLVERIYMDYITMEPILLAEMRSIVPTGTDLSTVQDTAHRVAAAAAAVDGSTHMGTPDGVVDSMAYPEDASLIMWVATQVPKDVSKDVPNPGETSKAGVSAIWQQLRHRQENTRLAGISPHQGSSTSFTISIPYFNTTLSRVDRLEIAAVVEILLALRYCKPRNVDASVAENLRHDIVRFVQHMDIEPKDGPGLASYTLKAPSGLRFPDMVPLYKVVLTRIHRWADQMLRRAEKDSLAAPKGRGGKRRRRAEDDDPSAPRTKRIMPSRATTAGVGAAIVGEGDDDDEEGWEEAPWQQDVDESEEGQPGMDVDESEDAALRDHLREGVQEAGTPLAPPDAAAQRAADYGLLPPFAEVALIFQQPLQHIVEFEKLLSYLRRCFTVASMVCGVCPAYHGAIERFCKKWATEICDPSSVLVCVAVYSSIYECQVNGSYSTVLKTVDMYLAE